ncbi:response regulator [Desulfovibrio sp. OttesenSCG-928-C06]|nr:response regulator [Desulfovibrio sp. OttesenSCG-928-C06]
MPVIGRKTSILARIFIATIVPLILIFTTITVLVNSLIKKEAETFATKATVQFARNFSERFEDQLAIMNSVLLAARSNFENINTSEAAHARQTAELLLTSLLYSVPDMYSAWFSFEPGTFGPGRFSKSFVKINGKAVETLDITNIPDGSSELFPSYDVPRQTGEPYHSSLSLHDYGVGDGSAHIGTISVPLYRDGEFIGCLGLDIKYSELLNFMDGLNILDGKYPLYFITDDRQIIYATEAGKAPGARGVLAREERIDEAVRSRQEVVHYTQNPATGQELFVCLTPVFTSKSAKPLLLYIEVPAVALQAGAKHPVQTFIMISVMGFLIMAISIFVTTRNIVSPIKQLTEMANEMADGDLEVHFEKVADTTNYEVHSLQVSLQKMLHQMGQMHTLKMAAMTADFEKEKIKATAVAKTQFFASMSHEIRTPMNAITGLSELLLNENLTETQRKYVDDIKTSSGSLLKIVNDILDSSKMEAGKFELVPHHFSLPMLLDNLCSIMDMLTSEKKLSFSYEHSGDLPECLYGDDERLRQILLNLLGNAVKYTARGFVLMRVSNEGATLLFEVTDSGMGIKPEAFSVIFDPYSQGSGNEQKLIEGTGLGLSIAKNIVTLMEGEIWVESVRGKGSSFFVRLPLVPGDPDKLDNDLSNVPVACIWTDVNALIVDDNAVNLNVAHGLLRLHGIEADMASSGREALGMIQKKEYDIIFMDHMMPGMDGVETTLFIRSMGGIWSSVPIIALTANAMPGTRDMLLDMGMSDFVVKPIEIVQLRAVLLSWLPESKKIISQNQIALPVIEDNRDELPEILREAGKIPGLDIEIGLGRVCGSHDTLEKSLRLSASDLPGSLDRIKKLMTADTKDMPLLHMEFHTLKGSLANIGAMSLSNKLHELELAAKQKNAAVLDVHFSHFYDKLAEFSHALGELMQEHPEKGGSAEALEQGSPELLTLKYHELLEKISQYDYDAITAIMQELAGYTFGEESDLHLQKLGDCIARFSYEECRNIILEAIA